MRVSDGPLWWGARQPGRPAILNGARQTTYGELATEALAVARSVRDRLGDGSRLPVALQAGGPHSFLAAFLGIVHAGAIAAPLSPDWTAQQVAAALRSCPPAMVLGDLQWPVDQRPAPAGPVSEAAFYVGFSSGSTGEPKAIVRSHDAWLKSFLAMNVEFGVGGNAVVALPGSLFFSFSLIAALQALYTGAAIRVPESPSAGSAVTALAADVDTAYILPSTLDTLSRRLASRGQTAPNLRRLICAGEKLHAATRQAARAAFPSAAITEYYGASELGFVTVIDDAETARRPSSVGRPFLGSQVTILDEHGDPCAPGEVGLVAARTGYGFCGYYGDPAGSSRIDHHGWATVGDLGWLEDGYLYLAGRRDSMAVVKGVNVYPEQVEMAIHSVAGVEAVAVVAEPAARGPGLVAYVVTGGPQDPAAIRRACSHLGPQAIPRVEFVREIPRTATGKVARRAPAGEGANPL